MLVCIQQRLPSKDVESDKEGTMPANQNDHGPPAPREMENLETIEATLKLTKRIWLEPNPDVPWGEVETLYAALELYRSHAHDNLDRVRKTPGLQHRVAHCEVDLRNAYSLEDKLERFMEYEWPPR
jgi:hypothetical protein